MKEIKETIKVLKEMEMKQAFNKDKYIFTIIKVRNILENLDEDKIKKIFRENHTVVFDCVCIRESEWNTVIRAILKSVMGNKIK